MSTKLAIKNLRVQVKEAETKLKDMEDQIPLPGFDEAHSEILRNQYRTLIALRMELGRMKSGV